jgi:hypothetical protein
MSHKLWPIRFNKFCLQSKWDYRHYQTLTPVVADNLWTRSVFAPSVVLRLNQAYKLYDITEDSLSTYIFSMIIILFKNFLQSHKNNLLESL